MGTLFSGKRYCRLLVWAALVCVQLASNCIAQVSDTFIVRDIRVEGLQRISEGAVFNYLPINIGDEVDRQRIQEAMRAVFATEFFRDVELRRDGDTLVIAVMERPTIADFEITGNKDIETEDLMDSLEGVGLKRGRILNQSVLDDVERSLTDEYFSQGKYAAQVKAEVVELPDNQVEITIKIKEGKRAKIRQINIVGNTVFDDKELLDQFALRTPHLLSFFKNDDRYSREALQGDIETLRSYYMDRGYADFRVESVQVAISPDKQNMFITINIVEGELFTISDVELAGDLILPEAALAPYVQVRPGQIFSQQALTNTEELIQLRLGEEGYAFTEVEPVTDLNDETREVKVTFYVDPKNRVYVRQINFNGADAVNDEVFRREVRQFEGGYLSKSKLERSKVRLQRLPYLENVSYTTTPVPGTADQVDVDFDIEEGLPGQFGGGLGYSDAQGIILNLNFVHTNFLGTGNRVQGDLNLGEFSKVIGFSYTNPYVSINEISRTVSASYRKTTQLTSAASELDTKTLTFGLLWGYPLTEFQRISMGFNLQQQDLTGNSVTSSEQSITWLENNGNRSLDCVPVTIPPCLAPGSTKFVTSDFATLELTGGWSFDTRNRALFATRGFRHNIGLSAAVPGSEVEFWYLNYNYTQYIPLNRYFTLSFDGRFGYGKAYGDTTSLPPYRNFFAGGPNTVRGYVENSLGPLDTLNNPYGGNMLVAAQTELILPIPRSWQSRSRFVLFYDIGNVFSNENIVFYKANTVDLVCPSDPTCNFYEFEWDALRQSYGLAVEWLAPLGLFRFSYGIPINEFKGGNGFLPDETENFQFNIGGAF